MIKYINYLMFFGILLLYCCFNHPMSKETGLTNGSNFPLTIDEQEKYETFINLFDIFSECGRNLIKKNDENIEKLSQDSMDEIKIYLNKHSDLKNWFSNNPKKQKELANAFTTVYEFLDNLRIKQSTNITTKQLLINTLKCMLLKDDQSLSSECSDNSTYSQTSDSKFHERIRVVFHSFLFKIVEYQSLSNELIFQAIKEQLLSNHPLDFLRGKLDKLELSIIENLNDSEKRGFDFFKKSILGQESGFYMLLTFDKDKLKSIFGYIDSELVKCIGDDVEKDKFKNVINNYFKNITAYKQLDKFKDQVKSSC